MSVIRKLTYFVSNSVKLIRWIIIFRTYGLLKRLIITTFQIFSIGITITQYWLKWLQYLHTSNIYSRIFFVFTLLLYNLINDFCWGESTRDPRNAKDNLRLENISLIRHRQSQLCAKGKWLGNRDSEKERELVREG